MNQEQTRQLRKYCGVLLRRKKLIITCCLLSVVAGLVQYIRTPKVYRATSLLIYEEQSINPTKKSLDAHKRIQEMVNTVSQQVTSRSSLEGIILKQELYTELLTTMRMEDVVGFMRKHILTELEQGDVFRVSFIGPDPQKVTAVTNALASRFIEENLRFRGERASETFTYVKDELRMAKDSLDKKEAIMRDYKLKYYNELPEQLPNNMSRLNSLQNQYQSNQNSSQEMERTKLLIQEQISLRRESLSQQDFRLRTEDAAHNQNTGQSRPPVIQDIDQLRLELESLRARYTDNHPEIRRKEKILKSMEEAQQKRLESEGANALGDKEDDAQIEQLKIQLRDSEYNINRLNKDRLEILSQIEQYQEWIAATPVREAEWSALTRDYNQLSNHYQGLVSQKLQAESAESLERRQKGSQFKIIDPANLPGGPFKPNFQKIMLMALVLSLGIGAGLAFAVEEFFDSSFKDPDELEAFIGLPVTCSIPLLMTPEEIRRKSIFTILWTILFIIAVSTLASAILYLIHSGDIIL